MSPKIAVISPYPLMNIGLKAILERIIPTVEVCTFGRLDEDAGDDFVHCFVSARIFADNIRSFAGFGRRVIVLTGMEQAAPPAGVPVLDVAQEESAIVRDILRLYNVAHGPSSAHAHAAALRPQEEAAVPLTERETEVLRAVVRGMINKEIADELNISINTVITHRRNIAAKLGLRSVALLTIYAVTHGIVAIDTI